MASSLLGRLSFLCFLPLFFSVLLLSRGDFTYQWSQTSQFRSTSHLEGSRISSAARALGMLLLLFGQLSSSRREENRAFCIIIITHTTLSRSMTYPIHSTKPATPIRFINRKDRQLRKCMRTTPTESSNIKSYVLAEPICGRTELSVTFCVLAAKMETPAAAYTALQPGPTP